MAQLKRKTVFTAEPQQIERVDQIVRSGRYRSASEFFREAIDEKLKRLFEEELARQVEEYCRLGYANEDMDLIAWQSGPGEDE